MTQTKALAHIARKQEKLTLTKAKTGDTQFQAANKADTAAGEQLGNLSEAFAEIFQLFKCGNILLCCAERNWALNAYPFHNPNQQETWRWCLYLR
ncbi:hypothetical protein DUNSADRAFT_15334 [Dunaliella salina]|uniref:Encoded protein n=1 Tax=Dunaliella salina TaxID=3046 RepID=A0ABQ7G5K2_DUNSA|nr:hypothetical protein DUNSADRAFT_15334 [Dunaliella salina]|eukprot:KAF5829891.1 hypothetical protein DUNSADRAFT_15334 [Dunaliella salina]